MLQAAPPVWACVTTAYVRVFIPSPHGVPFCCVCDAAHVPQAPQSPTQSTHACVLHSWVCGAGQVPPLVAASVTA